MEIGIGRGKRNYRSLITFARRAGKGVRKGSIEERANLIIKLEPIKNIERRLAPHKVSIISRAF